MATRSSHSSGTVIAVPAYHSTSPFVSLMRRGAPFLGGSALVLLSGCALLFTEPDPFQVTAEPPSVTISAQRTTVTLVGIPFTYFRCDYAIGLRATGGRSDDRARLQSAIVRGPSGERLGTIPLSELVSWFGTDQVRSGQRVTAQLYDEMLGSWSRSVEFLYAAPDGSVRSVAYSLNCV